MSLPQVERAVALTALEAEAVPARPGLYVAWLTDRGAFSDLGLTYPGVPRPAYIGIAGKRGLRFRLTQHAKRPFYELAEMLAARGKVLFPWHHRNPISPGRRFRPGPLCGVSVAQTLDWQHRNLFWSWTPCSPGAAARKESAGIKAHEPLVNRTHAVRQSPSLRWRGNTRAQARWLWMIAWAALNFEDRGWARLLEIDYERWQLNTPGLSHRVNSAGYPLPRDLWSSDDRRVRLPENWPTTTWIHKRMKRAARNAEPAVRQALAAQPNPAELQTWWSVHYAARFLPEPWDLDEALEAGLGMADERNGPGPARLPRAELRASLALLERVLGRVRH